MQYRRNLEISYKKGKNNFPDITVEVEMNKMNIAIVGLGNIGSYLFKYLKNKIILSKNNCIPNIIYVAAKNRNVIEVLKLIKDSIKII